MNEAPFNLFLFDVIKKNMSTQLANIILIYFLINLCKSANHTHTHCSNLWIKMQIFACVEVQYGFTRGNYQINYWGLHG